MSKPVFYIHVRARGVAGEIRLNDAPILELGLDNQQHAFPTVSEWVIDGENLLSLHVRDHEDEGVRIHLALCQAQLGDVPEPGNELELAVIDWPPAPLVDAVGEGVAEDVEAPLTPPLPPVLSASGVTHHPWGAWSWQTSPPFESTPRTTSEVISYVRDLHSTLASGRVDVLAAHSTVKFNEVSPIYGLTPAEVQARLTNGWAYMNGETGWELAAFDESDLDLRLRCGGQLVEPCTLGGEPILRQARPIGGESWSLPIFIARTNWEYIAGQLTIVR